MSVVVFLGPSLPHASLPPELDADVRPPAAVGDVLAAALRLPRAILLIDGYFERRLPVWHKEILWALAQGIHVFGASSMGALRAAELHPFGMQGVGRIFEAFRHGELEADDEVAVLHGPAELGFVAVSEALVNVRATLARAEAAGIVTAAQAATLLAGARSIHYRERTWEALLADGTDLPAAVAQGLQRWLPEGRVDLKRSDALAAVDAVAAFLAADPPPLQVGYRFAWTDAWDALFRGTGDGHAAAAVLDELRLDVETLAVVRPRALLRLLAGRERARSGRSPEPRAVRAAASRFRARLGLWRQVDLARWASAMDVDEAELEALLEEDALLDRLAREAGAALDVALLRELRATGLYGQLAQRAREKVRRLADADLAGPNADAAAIDLAHALARLAERARASGLGDEGDLAACLGFADERALKHAVLRETLFVRMVGNKAAGSTQAAANAQPAGSDEAKRER